MEDSIEDQTSNKWNNYVVNINGVKQNGGGVAASVISSSKEIEESTSPPYVVVPSFEMRWPLNNFTNPTTKPAFQLTSHKQLESQGMEFSHYVTTTIKIIHDLNYR